MNKNRLKITSYFNPSIYLGEISERSYDWSIVYPFEKCEITKSKKEKKHLKIS